MYLTPSTILVIYLPLELDLVLSTALLVDFVVLVFFSDSPYFAFISSFIEYLSIFLFFTNIQYNIYIMKYINNYKMFESLSAIQFSDIRDDVEGILIDLIDKGCYVDVYPGAVDLKQSNQPPYYINNFSIDEEGDGIYIKVGGVTHFKSIDIEEYILTVLDYLKIKYTRDFSTTFYVYNQSRWNTHTDYSSIDYSFYKFIISVKKE